MNDLASLQEDNDKLRELVDQFAERIHRAHEVIGKFAGKRVGSCCSECYHPIESGKICDVCVETITRGQG